MLTGVPSYEYRNDGAESKRSHWKNVAYLKWLNTSWLIFHVFHIKQSEESEVCICLDKHAARATPEQVKLKLFASWLKKAVLVLEKPHPEQDYWGKNLEAEVDDEARSGDQEDVRLDTGVLEIKAEWVLLRDVCHLRHCVLRIEDLYARDFVKVRIKCVNIPWCPHIKQPNILGDL